MCLPWPEVDAGPDVERYREPIERFADKFIG
jgi:hypothetical protein